MSVKCERLRSTKLENTTVSLSMIRLPNALSMILFTGLLLLVLLVDARIAHSQVDSTLIRVQALNTDVEDGSHPTYYSTEFAERATAIRTLLQSADTYLSKALGTTAQINIATLSEADWGQVWPFPYGLPYVSLGEPWVVVMPATPKQSVLFPMFTSVLSPDEATIMIDNIGFHEVGHIYASSYLYPSSLQGPPPVRWLDEFLAQYLAHAFLSEIAPERIPIWNTFTDATLSQPEPKYTTLVDFDKEYYGYLGSPEGTANYGWYQSLFAKKASEIFEDQGLDFIKEIKANLPWDQFDNWTTQTVLEALNKVESGFTDWLKQSKK